MFSYFHLDNRLLTRAEAAEQAIAPQFKKIDSVTEYNQQKVLAAFLENRVSESDFAATTGYGYGDRGRETLDKCFAQSMGAEAALVRHSFACGTATIACALFALLRPGDVLLCVTGTPYDTLHATLGLKKDTAGQGSLPEFGVDYIQVDLDENGLPNFLAIAEACCKHKPKVVYIQRSRGYTLRPSLSCETIAQISQKAKTNCNAWVFVDNCYGEFVQTMEPTQAGADLLAGSLIKNAGGGQALNGGYIAGKRELVERCAYRATCPGLGAEVGASLGLNRSLFMGLFQAPHVVGEALKTAVFAAALFETFGYTVSPKPLEPRYDIVQALFLKVPDALIAFCQGMQKGAPVDAFVQPEPWDMPGYDSKVIMAAGTFVFGASIELSADAPLREPYAAWMQGGLNYHSGKMGVLLAAQSMFEKGVLLV